MQKQDLNTSSELTKQNKIIISFIIALLPVIVWLIVWYSISMNTPDADPSGLQRLEELTLQIAVSGMLFIPTFRGTYSFLNRTR